MQLLKRETQEEEKMEHTLGGLIAEKRRELHLTQAQLAQKIGVTDKAVSKWERDLSCPDIGTIPRLAECLGVRAEELLQGRQEEKKEKLLPLILKAVALAMGVAAAVLGVLGRLELRSGFAMLGLGLACLALLQLQDKN